MNKSDELYSEYYREFLTSLRKKAVPGSRLYRTCRMLQIEFFLKEIELDFEPFRGTVLWKPLEKRDSNAQVPR